MSEQMWQEDIKNDELPRDLDAYRKGPDEFVAGQRIGWWYVDDEQWAVEHGEGALLPYDPPFSGVVVPREEMEMCGGICEVEDMLVVMDRYPVEKCYCEVTWMAYRRLLDDEKLVRVVVVPTQHGDEK